MFDYFYSIFFGIIQGLTEFIPVSSSGHLIVLHSIFDFDLKNSLSFDVFLHLGTLIALFIFFYKDIIKYIGAFFKSIQKPDLKNDFYQRMAWFILVASIPAFIVGYLLEESAESSFRSPNLVASMLVIGGLLFIIFEKLSRKYKTLGEIGFLSSVIIGLFQALAIIPGVSRSGITVIGGLTQGLKREEAARFSFLLAIPVIFGAVVKRAGGLFAEEISLHETLIFFSGLIASLLTGYLVIGYLLRFLTKHRLNIFAYYRFVLAILVFGYFLFY